MKRSRFAIAALAAVCAITASCGKVESIGRHWVLRYRANVSELRNTNPTLFAKTASGEVEVMKQIETCNQVAGDCLVFSSFDDGEYYFACSGRRPLLMLTKGLRGRASIVVDSRALRLIDNAPSSAMQEVFSVDRARRSALRQPPIRQGWWKDPELERIEPDSGPSR